MQLLISLLPFLLRLTLVFQGAAVEAVVISPTDLIAFSDDIKSNSDNLQLFSAEPIFPPLARKLETEEKEIEFYDLFIDGSYHATSIFYGVDTSLSFFDYRKTHDNPHLYDLFHSWKTHLS